MSPIDRAKELGDSWAFWAGYLPVMGLMIGFNYLIALTLYEIGVAAAYMWAWLFVTRER